MFDVLFFCLSRRPHLRLQIIEPLKKFLQTCVHELSFTTKDNYVVPEEVLAMEGDAKTLAKANADTLKAEAVAWEVNSTSLTNCSISSKFITLLRQGLSSGGSIHPKKINPCRSRMLRCF